MKPKESSLMLILVVALFLVGLWGGSENTKRTILEWDLEVYKTRLMKYEDSSVVQGIIDSLHKDYSDEMEFDRKALGR